MIGVFRRRFDHAASYVLPVVLRGAQATAEITGTATASITEADIVAGTETIIIELTGDAWVSAGASFNAQRQAIIDGLDNLSASPTFGWNNEVRDKEVVGAVVRTSSTVCTITLTAAAAYDITAQETITVTVPAAAVDGAAEITATPTPAFTVDFVSAGTILPFMQHYLAG